jgi:hypothetical protein
MVRPLRAAGVKSSERRSTGKNELICWRFVVFPPKAGPS